MRGRQLVLGIAPTMLGPEEEKEIFAHPPQPFVLERLVVPRIPDSKWWKMKRAFGATVFNVVFCIPIFVHWLRHNEWLFYRLRFPMPDDRVLLDIRVGGVSQFVVHGDGEPNVVQRDPVPMASGFSMDVFHPNSYAPDLLMGPADAKHPISFVVKNFSNKPLPFQAALVGYTVGP
jgi:hypothetical protein